MNNEKPINRAFSLFASQADMAKATGVSQPVVHKWLTTGRISAASAVRIERATRDRDPAQIVWRWELNDLFRADLDDAHAK